MLVLRTPLSVTVSGRVAAGPAMHAASVLHCFDASPESQPARQPTAPSPLPSAGTASEPVTVPMIHSPVVDRTRQGIGVLVISVVLVAVIFGAMLLRIL